MDNRTWTPWYYEYPWYSKTEQVVRERDQARRVARALYRAYRFLGEFDIDPRDEPEGYFMMQDIRRILAEEAR